MDRKSIEGSKRTIYNKKIAYGILKRADRSRYGKLIEDE
jgi:hypothetical protein